MGRSGTSQTKVTTEYAIVLWFADTSRYASMVASHLFGEGLLAVNRGRIDNSIPVSVGVANTRRWPIFSREVSASGLICSRYPKVSSMERHDFLVTVVSGQAVDAGNAPRHDLSVITLEELANTVTALTPSSSSKRETTQLFSKLAAPAIHGKRNSTKDINVQEIAELCIRIVAALAEW